MIYHLQIILIKFFFEKLVQAKIIFNFINMLKIKFFLYKKLIKKFVLNIYLL